MLAGGAWINFGGEKAVFGADGSGGRSLNSIDSFLNICYQHRPYNSFSNRRKGLDIGEPQESAAVLDSKHGLSECLELKEKADDYNTFDCQAIESGLLEVLKEVPTNSVGGLDHFVEN